MFFHKEITAYHSHNTFTVALVNKSNDLDDSVSALTCHVSKLQHTMRSYSKGI